MISLIPIGDETYRSWKAQAIKDYASDKIEAGAWAADRALELSEQEFNQLLPNGPLTPNNIIYAIRDDAPGQDVGVLWFSILERGGLRIAFIYDFIVFEQFRRKGYGRAALLALEPKVRELGLYRIGLHVFGHNPAAKTLYEKVGYEITDINMVKKLR